MDKGDEEALRRIKEAKEKNLDELDLKTLDLWGNNNLIFSTERFSIAILN